MIYLKKSKNIFVSLLFSGSVNSNLYCGCCPCSKNNSTSGDGSEEKDKEKDKGKDKGKDKDKKDKEKDKEKDKDKKDKDKKQQEQNNNVIYNLGGVVGLTCKLENNKVCLYTKVPSNDNYKFAESVENFNGEFKYENFKDLKINIKIKEFGIDWKDILIEKQIEFFKENLDNVKSFEFLSNKIIFFTGDSYCFLLDLSDMRIYRNMTKPQSKIDFLQNVNILDPKNKKLYGIISNGKYYKQTGEKTIDDSDENQDAYKKAFFEGK